jgi:hypothetical protein
MGVSWTVRSAPSQTREHPPHAVGVGVVLAGTQALQDHGRFPDFASLRAAQQASGSEVNVAGLLRRLPRFFQDENRDLLAETATKAALVAEPAPRMTITKEGAGYRLRYWQRPGADGAIELADVKRERDPVGIRRRIAALRAGTRSADPAP